MLEFFLGILVGVIVTIIIRVGYERMRKEVIQHEILPSSTKISHVRQECGNWYVYCEDRVSCFILPVDSTVVIYVKKKEDMRLQRDFLYTSVLQQGILRDRRKSYPTELHEILYLVEEIQKF